MEIIKAIKTLRGSPVTIPDCPRDNLPEFCVQMGYKRGAEIGVYKGEFTEQFCKVGMKMYAIDPWKAFSGQGRSQKRQERQDFLYEHTCRVLSPYKDCEIWRNDSMSSARFIKKESLDFVYIDGDHSFPAVAQDIWYWAPKVRVGGMVAGHDYYLTSPISRNTVCHVKPVIDAFMEVMQIKNWYVLEPIENRKRADRYPSWIWIKE